MPKCLNCGSDQLAIKTRLSTCSALNCSTKLHIAEGSTDTFYCPPHQQEFSTKIKNLESKVAELERSSHGRGSISTPTQEIQALRTENQTLTTTLSLKDREKKDLQAQIRGLETQLTEQDQKIEKVKKKLEEWSKLLTK